MIKFSVVLHVTFSAAAVFRKQYVVIDSMQLLDQM